MSDSFLQSKCNSKDSYEAKYLKRNLEFDTKLKVTIDKKPSQANTVFKSDILQNEVKQFAFNSYD